MDLNQLKEQSYEIAKSVGFHSSNELIILGNYISNLHAEISELWEAYRKQELNSPCDKAEKMKAANLEVLTCAEKEIADILIRTLDMAAALNIDVEKAVRIKSEFNKTRPFRNGNKIA
jgi:NTP pyrophosphatase (non-canonical NTP hydrolase)